MNNKEKICTIDKMIELYHNNPDDYTGLCSLYRDFKDNDYDNIIKAFPAIEFFARLFGGMLNYSFWWTAGDFVPRLKTLKWLKRWYKFKSHICKH